MAKNAHQSTTIKIQKDIVTSRLFNREGDFKEQYKDRAGYILYSEKYTHNNMGNAFDQVQKELGHNFKELGWGKKVQGSNFKLKATRNFILETSTEIDLKRWYEYGTQSLDRAAIEYLKAQNVNLVHQAKYIESTKKLIVSSLSTAELELLGWDKRTLKSSKSLLKFADHAASKEMAKEGVERKI